MAFRKYQTSCTKPSLQSIHLCQIKVPKIWVLSEKVKVPAEGVHKRHPCRDWLLSYTVFFHIVGSRQVLSAMFFHFIPYSFILISFEMIGKWPAALPSSSRLWPGRTSNRQLHQHQDTECKRHCLFVFHPPIESILL